MSALHSAAPLCQVQLHRDPCSLPGHGELLPFLRYQRGALAQLSTSLPWLGSPHTMPAVVSAPGAENLCLSRGLFSSLFSLPLPFTSRFQFAYSLILLLPLLLALFCLSLFH